MSSRVTLLCGKLGLSRATIFKGKRGYFCREENGCQKF